MAGGAMISTGGTIEGGFLTGRALYYPVFLITLLFFLWGFSYGLLDVLNSHFQAVLSITKLQSTGLQVMYFGGGFVLTFPSWAQELTFVQLLPLFANRRRGPQAPWIQDYNLDGSYALFSGSSLLLANSTLHNC